jgi:RHS repeat-associated protein
MPLDSSGSFVGAAHVTTSPQNGSWYLGFNYSGDVNYLPVSQTVQLTAVTNPLTLSCSPNTISSGGSTSCTAQVVGVTSGTISLYLDGALQGTNDADQSGSVVITIPATSLPPGSHIVTASYFLDDQTLSGTATQSITVTGGSGPPGNIYNYSITDSNGNPSYSANGNVLAYTDSVNGQWTLGYDSVNRLYSAGMGGNYNCWAYDSFGNRTAQGAQSTLCPSPGSSIPSGWTQLTVLVSNQLTGTADSNTPLYNYDPAGDMLTALGDNNTSNGVLYDAEGRICATRQPISAGIYRQTAYIYDAEGNRVAEGTIQDWNCDITQPSFQQTKAFIVGPSGEQMTELNVDADENLSWLHTNVSANSQLIATYANDNGGSTPQTGAVHFFLSDWLGTKRVQTAHDGSSEFSWANLPFGDGCNCNDSEQHFTGKERDAESGLDYFGARYYSSNMARFSSPDPSQLYYADLGNPQSFNLYSYGRNNPLGNIDPTGLDCVRINNDTGAYEGFQSGDCDNSTEALANTGHYIDGTVNQISFNGQNQVIGYSASTSDGMFDTPGASSGPAAVNFNPYTLAFSNPGQSVDVTANPLTGVSPVSVDFVKNPLPRPMDQVSRWPPLLTTGQIYAWCGVASTLQNGGFVPGGGTMAGDPSMDQRELYAPTPGGARRENPNEIPGQNSGTGSAQTNENAGKGASPAGVVAVIGTAGSCVQAVSAANR